MFMNPIFRENSGVKLLFEHLPSQAGEIDLLRFLDAHGHKKIKLPDDLL